MRLSRIINIAILLALSELLFSACASAPPAMIKNGVYLNSNFGFSMSVPKGWHHTSEMPDWIKKDASIWRKLHTQLMLFNNDTNGFIGITCFETMRPSQGILDVIKEAGAVYKKELQAEQYVKNYSANFFPISDQSIISLVSKQEMDYENELYKLKGEWNDYFYERVGKPNCVLTVVLISPSRFYEENLKVYEEMLRSLSKIK